MDDKAIARGDSASVKGCLVCDNTGKQDSAVRLVIQTSRRDLLPIYIGFWGLDLSHLFGGLSHMSGDDGLYGHRPDGRAKVLGCKINLGVIARLANREAKCRIFVSRRPVCVQ